MFLRRHSSVSLSLLFSLLPRLSNDEDFLSLLEDLLPRRSISERLQLLHFALQQTSLHSLKEKFLERVQRLKIFEEWLEQFHEEELNQLDQTENNDEREEILAEIFARHGHLSFLVRCKQQIFPHLSLQRILRLIVEKINEQIKSDIVYPLSPITHLLLCSLQVGR